MPVKKKKKNILSKRGSENSPLRPQYGPKEAQFESAELKIFLYSMGAFLICVLVLHTTKVGMASFSIGTL
jgi:hypothetical protein